MGTSSSISATTVVMFVILRRTCFYGRIKNDYGHYSILAAERLRNQLATGALLVPSLEHQRLMCVYSSITIPMMKKHGLSLLRRSWVGSFWQDYTSIWVLLLS